MKSDTTTTSAMKLRGVRVHNLKNISLDIPLGKLVVITGISGSGKSSLAFDTIFAEGQRLLLDTLPLSSQLSLEQLERPDATTLDGIPPAFLIRQRGVDFDLEITLGEMSGLTPIIERLFLHHAKTICPVCLAPVSQLTSHEISNFIENAVSSGKISTGSKCQVAFLIELEKKSELKQKIQELNQAGFHRVFQVDHEKFSALLNSGNFTPLENGKKSRTGTKKENLPRQISLNLEVKHENLLNEYVKTCGKSAGKPDSKKLISSKLLVIVDRFLAGKHDAERLCESARLAFSQGQGSLVILLDKGNSQLNLLNNETTSHSNRSHSESHDHDCSHLHFHQIILENQPWDFLLLTQFPYCPSCNLRFNPLSVKPPVSEHKHLETVPLQYIIGNLNYHQLLDQQISNWSSVLLELIEEHALIPCDKKFDDRDIQSSSQHDEFQQDTKLTLLKTWLSWLKTLSLDHVSLNTSLRNLSTGEAQRLGICRAVNLNVVQTMFVIDEPCAGSHPEERPAIYELLQQLRNSGNSVIVVEHDPEILKFADEIVDLGPDAGLSGGNLVFQGKFDDFLQSQESITAKWIRAPLSENYSDNSTHRWKTEQFITINYESSQSGIRKIPLKRFVVITGKSNSPARKFLNIVLFPLINSKLSSEVKPAYSDHNAQVNQDHENQELSSVDECLHMTGRPGKAHRLQTIITAFDLFTEIRQLFAQTHEAKLKGYKPGEFSFASAKGRKCPKCQGQGFIVLHFPQFAPLKTTCPSCHGGRFQPQLNDVLYRGINISQVLQLNIDDAFQFFKNIPKLQKGLFALKEAGLGYLTLGRNLDTLSGGEFQRFLLAQKINAGSGKRTIFLFEEPSIGLHPENKHQLIKLFFHLLELGHSVIAYDNDPQIVNAAEIRIDF